MDFIHTVFIPQSITQFCVDMWIIYNIHDLYKDLRRISRAEKAKAPATAAKAHAQQAQG